MFVYLSLPFYRLMRTTHEVWQFFEFDLESNKGRAQYNCDGLHQGKFMIYVHYSPVNRIQSKLIMVVSLLSSRYVCTLYVHNIQRNKSSIHM